MNLYDCLNIMERVIKTNDNILELEEDQSLETLNYFESQRSHIKNMIDIELEHLMNFHDYLDQKYPNVKYYQSFHNEKDQELRDLYTLVRDIKTHITIRILELRQFELRKYGSTY